MLKFVRSKCKTGVCIPRSLLAVYGVCRMRGGTDEMRLAITIMVIALVASIACPCFAGNNPASYCAVHVKAYNRQQNCTTLPPIAGCADIELTYSGFSFDAFPVFYDLTEYKGFEYAMTWPDWTYSAAFTNCADLLIDGIVWPGDEVSHAWTLCQDGPVAIPGWLWMEADGPGQVCIVDAVLGIGSIAVLDCSEGLDSPLYSFCAGVYGEIPDKDNPCDKATEPVTWSAIKELFR